MKPLGGASAINEMFLLSSPPSNYTGYGINRKKRGFVKDEKKQNIHTKAGEPVLTAKLSQCARITVKDDNTRWLKAVQDLYRDGKTKGFRHGNGVISNER